jgi:phage-related protein
MATEDPPPHKTPLIFFRTAAGWRWPVGMPLCRAMGDGLWEIRTDLPTKRTARVLLCVYREHLVALNGFIKKTRATPDENPALARRRRKELMK